MALPEREWDRLRLLRGRILVEVLDDVRSDRLVIVQPDPRKSKIKIHEARVLKLGAPPLTKAGVEVPWQFGPGDTIVFAYGLATEKFRSLPDNVRIVHVDEVSGVRET